MAKLPYAWWLFYIPQITTMQKPNRRCVNLFGQRTDYTLEENTLKLWKRAQLQNLFIQIRSVVIWIVCKFFICDCGLMILICLSHLAINLSCFCSGFFHSMTVFQRNSRFRFTFLNVFSAGREPIWRRPENVAFSLNHDKGSIKHSRLTR